MTKKNSRKIKIDFFLALVPQQEKHGLQHAGHFSRDAKEVVHLPVKVRRPKNWPPFPIWPL